MFDICIYIPKIFIYMVNIFFNEKQKFFFSIIASWVMRVITKTQDRMGLTGIGQGPVPGLSICTIGSRVPASPIRSRVPDPGF